MFNDVIAEAKASGLELLTDTKAFLEAVTIKAGGKVETIIPMFSADVESLALSMIANPAAQSFVKMILDNTGMVPAVDALVIKYLGQALLRLEAIINTIPGTSTA